jgi:alpha-tubulin suppressor-like RCC1 family protein
LGANNYGQVDPSNSADSIESAVSPLFLAEARSVEMGHQFTCGIFSVGQREEIRCSGDGRVGQTGQGATNARSVRTISSDENSWARIVNLSTGFNHACALVQHPTNLGDREVWCWGANNFGQAGRAIGASPELPADPLWAWPRD